jgi:hypothetical protein
VCCRSSQHPPSPTSASTTADRRRCMPQRHQLCSVQTPADLGVQADSFTSILEVGLDPVYPVGTIPLPVTFRTEDNFRTENVQFEVAEVNLPFNAIIGRPALYRFMAVAHYGYLVLKMPTPAGVLTVQSERAAAVMVVEKLHALATGLAPVAGAQGSYPSTSRAIALAKAPKVLPSDTDDVPMKTVQVGAETSQTTRIGGNLGEK